MWQKLQTPFPFAYLQITATALNDKIKKTRCLHTDVISEDWPYIVYVFHYGQLPLPPRCWTVCPFHAVMIVVETCPPAAFWARLCVRRHCVTLHTALKWIELRHFAWQMWKTEVWVFLRCTKNCCFERRRGFWCCHVPREFVWLTTTTGAFRSMPLFALLVPRLQ